jgi:hypothetical protein
MVRANKTVYAFCTNRYAAFIHVFIIIAAATTTTTTTTSTTTSSTTTTIIIIIIITNYYDYKDVSIGIFHCTMKIIVVIVVVDHC